MMLKKIISVLIKTLKLFNIYNVDTKYKTILTFNCMEYLQNLF